MNPLVVLLSLLTIIIYLLYVLANKKFNYWKKRNVPFVKPLPILGNYGSYILLREFPGQMIQKLCQQFPKLPYFGAFFGTEPVLVVQSPELLKEVFTKDFYYYNGREVSDYQKKESMTQNFFFSSGDKWKVERQNLNPLFSSAKMKNMFPFIKKYSHVLEDTLDSEISVSDVIEAKDLSARYTMDCVCACGFGVESNTLTHPENNPFKFMADEIFSTTRSRGFKIICRAVWPAIFYGTGLKLFPSTTNTFFSQLLKRVFESRNYTFSAITDFVDMMLNWQTENVIIGDSIKNSKAGHGEKAHVEVTDDVLVSLCTLFFAAGYETSATTISYTLFELAKYPEVQKRAAEEVDEYLRRHNNKLSYGCVSELPYLTACMDETLRMYPLFGVLTREVMDDVTLPDGLHLGKGLRVHIPVYALHHDPDYFPEPEVYKPERFLSENKGDIKSYTYLPFGEGPRNCIGKRIAKMQVLTYLVTLLKKYRLKLADGMPKTVDFENRMFLLQPKAGQKLMLTVSEREGWEQRTYDKS